MPVIIRDNAGGPNAQKFKSMDNLEFEVLEKYIMRKFPEKHRYLKEKYGVVQWVWNDTVTDIIDIVAPEEYLEELDDIERARLEGQPVNTNIPRLPVTSTLLKSLAETERNFYKTETELFRTEPGYLSRRILADAGASYELMPDINGNAANLKDLLSRPRFISQIARFVNF
ncbi:hypothetical protein K435DRAFT_801123 [Dendrothele bispora CBS 962.96]|uniref:Uncharacterized protein n=1 Tax=Dendrothele bispora (strain CBS 962.96) TaxID=1314807 RepID=A0A4S8LQ99_DENBC|nr:hypothetical protein K435DRAFT_801123 [Dendrothele bispora CBS 962.96]